MAAEALLKGERVRRDRSLRPQVTPQITSPPRSSSSQVRLDVDQLLQLVELAVHLQDGDVLAVPWLVTVTQWWIGSDIGLSHESKSSGLAGGYTADGDQEREEL